MLDWIYNLFGSMLSWFNSITGSYAIALFLYALVFKIVFLPFSIKQQKTQIAMAKLRPKMLAIEKKYAGRADRASQQKKQQEILELQQKEGASPLAGCLPLLLQFPIIIFLYNVIRNPLSYLLKITDGTVYDKLYGIVHNYYGNNNIQDQIGLINGLKDAYANGHATEIERAAGAGFMNSLPNFDLFGVNLAETPSLSAFSLLVLIPVLAAAFQWLTMFLTRRWSGNAQMTGDAQAQMSNRIMDIIFPLLTLWMAFSFSGMLGLYWIYQSVLAILQTFILNKAMPLPKYTAEEMKEMEKAQKAAQKAQQEVIKSQPKYRSLHYIDEDDYDDLPTIKSSKPKNVSGDAPELKDDRNKR